MNHSKAAAALVFLLLFLCFGTAGATGYGNVEVHLNGGDDVAYIGETNTIEIWIENDAVVDGLSLGFEFSIGRDFQFNASYGSYGYVNEEGRVVGAFNLFASANNYFDAVSPDSVLIGGASIGSGLPAGWGLCYTLEVDIPSGQSDLPDGFCIDNVFIPTGGSWGFHDNDGTYPPLYQGNYNTSTLAPDAPPVCFDIVNRVTNPPEISNCPPELVGNHCDVVSYQFTATDPDPGDQISWAVISGPGTITTQGGLYTVQGLEAGNYDVVVEVVDLYGNYDQCPFTLYMTNNAPFLVLPCEDQIAYFGELLTYQIQAGDPDPCDMLNYGLMNVSPTPDGLMSVLDNGLFEFDPTELDIGVQYDVAIEISDGWESVDCNFVVTVRSSLLFDVDFVQLDWYDTDSTLAVENSVWGRFDWSYYTDDSLTYYLNLTISNGGSYQWMVQNLPLFPTLPVKERREGVYLDLEDLGISDGEEIGAITYVATVTPEPLLTQPVTPILPATFTSEDRFAWDRHYDVEPPMAASPAPVNVRVPATATQIGSDRDVGAVQEGNCCCMAGSIARSVDWLNRTHALGINANAQEIYDGLRTAGVSVPGEDVTVEDWIEAKVDYTDMNCQDRIVTKVWDRGNTFIGPIAGLSESNEGLIDWLKREIKTEDIELAYCWWDPASGTWKAHIVTIVDVFEDTNGDIYVKYREDGQQGNSAAGDSGVLTAKLAPHDGGWYGLGSTGNFLYFGLSESAKSTAVIGESEGVRVRETFTVHQRSFRQPQFANDLHFKVWTDSDINGADIEIIGFGEVEAAQNGTREISVDCAKGQVPYCTHLKIDVSLYLNNRNEKHVRDVRWTRTGREEAKACPDFGWMIDPPVETAPGEFMHRVHLYNDDLTDPILLDAVELKPANNFVYDLTTLNAFTYMLPTMTLSPQESYVYDLYEYDAMSSHIYGHFLVRDEMENQLVEDWFDHPTTSYVVGDADGNSIVNISDAVSLISYIFGGGPAPVPVSAGDADCSGFVNITDAVYLIAYIFGGGPAPGDCPEGSTRLGPFCVTNDTGTAKQGVTIVLAGTGGTLSNPIVTEKPEGCGDATVDAQYNTVTITFDSNCIPAEGRVCFTVCSMHSPIEVAGVEWF